MVQWWLQRWRQALQQDPAQGLASCVLDFMAILLCCNLIDPAINYATVLHSFQTWGFPPQRHLQAVLDAVQLSDEQFAAMAAARRVHQDILLPLVAAGQEVQQELTQLLQVMQQEQQRRSHAHAAGQRGDRLFDAGSGTAGVFSTHHPGTPTAATAAAPAAEEGASVGRGGCSGPFPDLQVAQDTTAVELYEQLRVLTRRLTAAHRTLGWLEQGQDFHAFGLLSFNQIAIMASQLRPWPVIIRRVAEYAALQWEARQQEQQEHQQQRQKQRTPVASGVTSGTSSSSASAGTAKPRPCWSYTHEEMKQQQAEAKEPAAAAAAAAAAQLPPSTQVPLGCAGVALRHSKQPSEQHQDRDAAQQQQQQQQQPGMCRPPQQWKHLQQKPPPQQQQQQRRLEQQEAALKVHMPCQQQHQPQQQQALVRQEPLRLSLDATPGAGQRLRLQLQGSSQSTCSPQSSRDTLARLQLSQPSNTMQGALLPPGSGWTTIGTAADAVPRLGAVATTAADKQAGVREAVEQMLVQLTSGSRTTPLPPPVAAAAVTMDAFITSTHSAAAGAGAPSQHPPPLGPLSSPWPSSAAAAALDHPFDIAPSSGGVGCAGDLLHPLQVCAAKLCSQLQIFSTCHTWDHDVCIILMHSSGARQADTLHASRHCPCV
jgi:hypothetical protein